MIYKYHIGIENNVYDDYDVTVNFNVFVLFVLSPCDGLQYNKIYMMCPAWGEEMICNFEFLPMAYTNTN